MTCNGMRRLQMDNQTAVPGHGGRSPTDYISPGLTHKN
ncbi:hypothetical protein Rcae01_00064 [Novipirellula caenicola]|uniref:Uncharacterized protein n=1 Tax=Novipirellula caenicola TaxID=1536901 RepID=A0ABP9VJ71_9BACT